MVGGFGSTLSVSVFHSLLVVNVIMIVGRKNVIVSQILNFIVCVAMKGAIRPLHMRNHVLWKPNLLFNVKKTFLYFLKMFTSMANIGCVW